MKLLWYALQILPINGIVVHHKRSGSKSSPRGLLGPLGVFITNTTFILITSMHYKFFQGLINDKNVLKFYMSIFNFLLFQERVHQFKIFSLRNAPSKCIALFLQ